MIALLSMAVRTHRKQRLWRRTEAVNELNKLHEQSARLKRLLAEAELEKDELLDVEKEKF